MGLTYRMRGLSHRQAGAGATMQSAASGTTGPGVAWARAWAAHPDNNE